MDWIEASVTTTTGYADAVSEVLMQNGAKGTQILDRSDVPKKDDGTGFGELYGEDILDNMPQEVTVKAWFSAAEDVLNTKDALKLLSEQAETNLGNLNLSVQNVKDEDWAENWKKYYKPMRVGKNLVIRPVWEEYQEESSDLVITMDPGMAFGTGTHETTRLCMEMIESHFKGGEALDIGTGSGILAIALSQLGAEKVTAVDIDPVAVKAAGENIARNRLENKVMAIQGDLTRDIQGPFDFVCANILADVIISLASPVKNLLRKGAPFLASGIIKDRKQDVLDAFLSAGYKLLDEKEQGEWVALLFGLKDA